MNLIDKYVAEVGKQLPRQKRADIQAEIRSTLEDMLEERNQASPDAEREAEVIALLKEYGEPRKVAESYTGPRYLIGPRMYPIFELVVKIVMACLLGVGLFGFAISGVMTKPLIGTEFFSSLGQFWVGLLGGMLSALGNMVIVFAILERVLPDSEFEKNKKEWDPAELAKEPDPDAVKVVDTVIMIIFTLAGLIIFNLYPNVVGFGFVTDGEWTYIPILSDAFFDYLPWINLLGIFQIVFSIYLLRQRVWTTFTRLCYIAIEVASSALAIVMLKGPSLVDISAGSLAGTSLAEISDLVTKVMSFVPGLALVIVIIVSGIEVAQTVYRLIRSNPSSPYPITK